MPAVPAAEIGPELDGAPTLLSVAFDLADVGYDVHEHLVTGEAVSYAAAGLHEPDGRWEVAPGATAPFATRLVVHCPADPAAARHTAVVEWLNVTGGLDTPAVWMPTQRHLVREGYTWVGITTQRVGVVGGGAFPGLGLHDTAPDRYGELHHPGDAFSFDLFGRVAAAVPALLADRYGIHVERLLATGASQSAVHLTTYVNAVDPHHEVFAGFLLQGRAGAAAPLEGWDLTAGGAANDVDARRARLTGNDRIRDDVRVPVLVVQSETDVLGTLRYLPARQDDGEHFRLWEVAGAAHCDTYFLAAAPHDSGALTPAELAALLARTEVSPVPTDLPVNTGPQMHYVLQRAVDALERWAALGELPPSAARLEVGRDGEPLHDALGVVRGGVRTPWVDAPVSILSGLGQTGVFGELFGTTRPLPSDALSARYPGGRDDHAAAFRAATDAAVDAGFLLAADAGEIAALGPLAWPA